MFAKFYHKTLRFFLVVIKKRNAFVSGWTEHLLALIYHSCFPDVRVIRFPCVSHALATAIPNNSTMRCSLVATVRHDRLRKTDGSISFRFIYLVIASLLLLCFLCLSLAGGSKQAKQCTVFCLEINLSGTKLTLCKFGICILTYLFRQKYFH